MPAVPYRQAPLVFLLMLVAVLGMTWPWLQTFSNAMLNHWDPPFHAWKLEYVARAILNGHLLPPDGNTNMYYPYSGTLYYEALHWPQALLAAPLFGWLNLNPVLVYHVILVLFWALTGVCTWMLMLALGSTRRSALLGALVHGWRSSGLWNAEAGTNNGDGGAHFYDAYACADGKYISIGSMEPPFYALLRKTCGLTDPAFDCQWDPAEWPALKERVAEVFLQKTRAEWCALLEGSDACFAPVLDLDEAPQHPHNQARGTFVQVNGITQPAPAPRFSATPAGACQPVGEAGADTLALLALCGYTGAEIAALTAVFETSK